MAAVSNESVFPVVLYIREKRIYCGNVEIRPALYFEQFRAVLNEIIAASYVHLATCIVDNRKPEFPLEQQKMLIAGKVSYSALDREKNINFFVDLPPAPPLVPGDVFVISLNHLNIIDPQMPASGTHQYEGRFHDLHTQRSNNIWSLNYRSSPPVKVNPSRIRKAETAVDGSRKRELCKDCRIAEMQGKVAPFHHCVYDEIITGFFRSPAGPIGRFKLHL